MKDQKSKLVLGTVQLGMSYGITNATGQPDKDEAFSILDFAWGNGICMFDTAVGYGAAENILGEWTLSRRVEDSVRVVSKIHLYAVQNNTDALVPELQASLTRLHLKKLDGYLLYSSDMNVPGVMEKLQQAKREGIVTNVGVSIYEPQEALDALKMGLDYIQVPYNVFDRRLDVVHFFERAEEAKVTVFARSPFLQGLLLMNPNEVPAHLSPAIPHMVRFREIVAAHGLSVLEAALLYAEARAGVDRVVFGVETLSQLKEILAVSSRKESIQCIDELKGAFKNIGESIVNPNTWKK